MKMAAKLGEVCENTECRYNSKVNGCCFALRSEYCFKELPEEITTARAIIMRMKAEIDVVHKVEGTVKLPERDEDRRRVFETMLGITRKVGNKFTAEELENLCLKRGYLTKAKKCPKCNSDMKERYYRAQEGLDIIDEETGKVKYDVPTWGRFKAFECKKCDYVENEDEEEISENQEWED